MDIVERFRNIFSREPEVVIAAPGRVNLIGEHTDYNEGFVLPAAIDRYCWYAGGKRDDRLVRAFAEDFSESAEFALDAPPVGGMPRWSQYLQGISLLIEQSGQLLCGADLVLGGDVPREAGLSSSAAVEMGAVAFWKKLIPFDAAPVSLVKLAQRAERDFVGVPCGIMDQFVSGLGRKGHALFLDCRNLEHRQVPLGGNTKIVVCNSGVKRSLSQSEYRVRTAQCAQAVERLRASGLAVNSLRDVRCDDLGRAQDVLEGVLLRRARHVVTENQRVLRAVRALEAEDLADFGGLMNQSHASLRDDYEVSSQELDKLVELAQAQPGVYGARMTGAGFGGCTVNLVRSEAAESFVEAVGDGYQKALGLKAEIYLLETADGALASSVGAG
ncbi:MAG: galactokinase [Terriglobia bacterium]